MVKVKICGLKNLNDVNYVNLHYPDYTGFVFAKSKRQVSMDQAKELSRMLCRDIKKVGVFVNQDVDTVVEIADNCKLNVIQLHGDEDSNYIDRIKNGVKKETKVWKALRVSNMDNVFNLNISGVDNFLLDSYSRDTYGGTGKTFDWNIALRAKKEFNNLILAGGLDTENVKKAVDVVQPYAVDVSSGVEINGVKDELKIKKFIYSVRYNLY